MMLSFDRFFSSDVVTFISDRAINFSFTDTDMEGSLSAPQRAFLQEQLGFDLPVVFNIRQVHGNEIVVASQEDVAQGIGLPEADGILTDAAYLPIVVRTADCLPVFLYDPARHGIGLLHAGWKGTWKGIVARAVSMMHQRWGTDAKELKAAFGPSIQSCCYEVGEEFKKYFPDRIVGREGRCYFDLPAENKRQLLQSGVLEEHIFDSGACTCCDKRYFSYRREGKQAGRMISLMMIREAL
jgi:YfiH family protein